MYSSIDSSDDMFKYYFNRPATLCLTLLEPQPRSGDKPVKFQVVLSPNGTAVLKGLRVSSYRHMPKYRVRDTEGVQQ